MVFISKNRTEVSQMCVLKEHLSRCNTRTELTDVCCCETSKCNDDAFVAACKPSKFFYFNSASVPVIPAPIMIITVVLFISASLVNASLF